MRLIDADAFIQMMEEKCDPESTLDPWVLSVCRGGVKMMPTVDAVPVRYGRWIHFEARDNLPPYDKCDQCGWMVRIGLNFCPACGAKNRRTVNGNDRVS